MRLILIAAALLGMAGSASAQYRSYGHSYGHSYYSAPTYSYYSAPTYSYSAPTYSYTWYDGTWYKGRWYKAGYYYYDGHCWYLKGHGAYYGEDKAAGPPPTKTHSGLSDEETAALRRLLAESEKPKTKPLSAAEVKRLKEVLDKTEE